MSNKLIVFPLVFTSFLFQATIASGQSPIPIYNPQTGKANVVLPNNNAGSRAVRAATAPNQSACTLIDFEGLADLAAIPDFQGISLPDWLSIVSEYEAGGDGNFRGEPSPVTIAFWLYGNPTSQNINIPNGASSVSFYYSSYYPITISAYDANNNLVQSTTGPANFDSGTGVYDTWSPISVQASNGSTITSLAVSGYANYTGIDNLNVCQSPVIDSVEITQAIQQYQTLSDLKATLTSTGEPPVPVIANKPAALRLYFSQVQNATPVTVNLSGVSTDSQSITLQPNCTDLNQRSSTNGCQSLDFYFTPPSGAWSATLDVVDGNGNTVQEEVLNVNSRATDSLWLRAVSVCDTQDASGNWDASCENPADLLGMTALLEKLAPTSSVTADTTNYLVTRNVGSYPFLTPLNGFPNWWSDVVRDVDNNYGVFDWVGDQLAGRRTTYFGMIRPSVGGLAGLANGIPSHGAAAVTSGDGFPVGQTVAHETGHTLGLRHTNTALPGSGCFANAPDNSTDWSYPTGIAGSASNTNYIQSSKGTEIGFDVEQGVPLSSTSTFELMGYCSPSWISPQRYKTMIYWLGGGSVASPSVVSTAGQSNNTGRARLAAAAAVPASSFWVVSGVLQGQGVQFDPLFQYTIQGDTSTGTGNYQLAVEDAAGNKLFVRQFTPTVPPMENPNSTAAGPPNFSQAIPTQPNAAAIVLLGPSGSEIGRLTLGGVSPAVTLTQPGPNFNGVGIQPVIWTAQSSSSQVFTSKVLFSANNGATWVLVGQTTTMSFPVNFDKLPGGSNSLIQVVVSDGINSGSATSSTFTIPKKQPKAVDIVSPVNNSTFAAKNTIFFSGAAYDPEDGALTGSSLKWSSNLQGDLGSGARFGVRLQPGNHTITLTATDSDGNVITATTNITVGGQPPALVLQVQPLNTVPTTCESATITAQPGVNGAPLTLVQYSTDGGNTYTTIPLANLPYKFIVPGSGFVHVVARAYDSSRQATVKDVSFLTQSACQTGEPTIQGKVTSQQLQSPGVYVVGVQFTNIGQGSAQSIKVNVSAQRLSGTGTIQFAGTNPVSIPNLSPGQSTTVSLKFTVPNPNTITRFNVIESGTLVDVFNQQGSFSTSQQVIP